MVHPLMCLGLRLKCTLLSFFNQKTWGYSNSSYNLPYEILIKICSAVLVFFLAYICTDRHRDFNSWSAEMSSHLTEG
jgi:glucan phosphoethanolaminetransferase (alkaline phosphatase superfamily)